MPFDPTAAAAFIADAHRTRATYRNLPDAIAPKSIDDAYAAQDALVRLWEPTEGGIAGLKIATTTKVMQALMGIDHPCGGILYANRIHHSPGQVDRTRFVHLVVECELAVRIGKPLTRRDQPYTRDEVRNAIDAVMPAYELIEDRHAIYKETRATSLIADNAWNGGVVLGPPTKPPSGGDFDKLRGRLVVNGVERASGLTDDPMGALAWVASLGAQRGLSLQPGMIVITGSVIPTLPIAPDERFAFSLDGLGSVEMSAP